MSHPIFEQTTSPLVRSNDGHLQVIKASHDSLPSTAWEVIDLRRPSGDRTELRTYNRSLADAFIAGYDHCERIARGRFTTYTALRDFLDGYTNEHGVIQGDPATIAAEAVGAGYVTADANHAIQFEDEPAADRQAAIREAWRQYPEATDTGVEE